MVEAYAVFNARVPNPEAFGFKLFLVLAIDHSYESEAKDFLGGFPWEG